MREIFKSVREFEVRMFPNACLDRLEREWRLKGWRVEVKKYEEDKKSGKVIVGGVEEEDVWRELERFYVDEGYEVRLGEKKNPRLEMRKGDEVYWGVVMGRRKQIDVFIFRSPMIEVEKELKGMLVSGAI